MKDAVSVLTVALLSMLGSIWLLFVFALIASIPLYLLWNWLMPVIFHVPSITLVQALGLAWLSAILFRNSSTVRHERVKT